MDIKEKIEGLEIEHLKASLMAQHRSFSGQITHLEERDRKLREAQTEIDSSLQTLRNVLSTLEKMISARYAKQSKEDEEVEDDS